MDRPPVRRGLLDGLRDLRLGPDRRRLARSLATLAAGIGVAEDGFIVLDIHPNGATLRQLSEQQFLG